MKKIYKLQLKVLLEEYKMKCAEAIAEGNTEKAQEYKERIAKIKNWLKGEKNEVE